MKTIFLIIFLLISNIAAASTIYIRTDGGPGTRCTGLTDAADTGSGSNQPCALNDPSWAFPPRAESTTRAAVAGDTVVIEGSSQHGTGSYRMGCRAGTPHCVETQATTAQGYTNYTQTAYCYDLWTYDCGMNTVPNNVTIIGCTTSGCGCSSSFSNTTKEWSTSCTYPRPELWGVGNLSQILSINGTTGVTVQDLELTDHASCGYPNPVTSANCGHGSDVNSLAATNGILQTSSLSVYYKNLNIHGLSGRAIFGGSVGDHTYDNVTMAYNGSAGIDYDSCSNNGTCGVASGKYMIFKNGTTIKYNGCVENYSGGAGSIVNLSCHDQNTSGYGDGLGGSTTSGNWTFTDVDISHNTSDGLDLLYQTSGTVSIKRGRFEGNVGDQVKTSSNITVEDSYIISNCAYFKNQAFSDTSINMCRGNGAVSTNFLGASDTNVPKFYNNTITSNDDVMFLTASACGSTTYIAKNNLLLAGTDYNAGDNTSIFYNSGSDGNGTGCSATFVEDYNTCSNNFKEASPCPASHSKNNIASSSTYNGTINQGPTTYYTSANYVTQLSLKSTSTAIGAADNTISGLDSLGYGNQDRGVIWDMGALDYVAGSSPTCGNGAIESGESCDDSNTTNGDGCSSACAVETGFSCSGTPSSCSGICGDSLVVGSEQCDTANLNGASCITQGFVSGTLACSSCSFDTSGCTSTGAKASIRGSYTIMGDYKVTTN